jgi:hypothetical protein
MVAKPNVLTISKLDAARRQLQTAITLWFAGGDPVSIHTLAYAAYEIIHAVSKQRNPGRRDLLFDSALIKDQYRRQWAESIKKHANFFKHAQNDGNSIIEFKPAISEMFLFYSLYGMELCGERHNDEESAFIYWINIHRTDLLTDSGREKYEQSLPVETRNILKSIRKDEFLHYVKEARRLTNKSSASLSA